MATGGPQDTSPIRRSLKCKEEAELCVSDKALKLVADRIGNDWVHLGIKLRIAWHELEKLSNRAHGGHMQFAAKVFNKWRQKDHHYGHTAVTQALRSVLVEVNRQDLTSEVTNATISDDFDLQELFQRITGSLTHEWRDIGTHLGISSNELDLICAAQRLVDDPEWRMLEMWRRRTTDNQRANLTNALRELKRNDLVKIIGDVEAGKIWSSNIETLSHVRFEHSASEQHIGEDQEDTCVFTDFSDSDRWGPTDSSQPPCYASPENKLEEMTWYHGKLPRREAEHRLLLPAHQPGTFLIRESETRQGTLSLSVRDKGNHVEHYSIQNVNKQGFFMVAGQTFNTMHDLIKHHSGTQDGLCRRLTSPCHNPKHSEQSRKMLDEWEIDRGSIRLQHKLHLLKSLGFEMWRGKLEETTDVAIKILSKNQETPATRKMNPEYLLGEVQAMMSLNTHDNLVRLYGVCSLEEPLYIVTEFMCKGPLLAYLRDGDGKNIALNTMVDMVTQIASGMEYLEQKHYIHLDLRAESVLVGQYNTVKVGRLRMAHKGDEYYASKRQVSAGQSGGDGDEVLDGPEWLPSPSCGLWMMTDRPLEGFQSVLRNMIRWMAPEAAQYGKYSIKSVVWSFGILVTEMLTYGKTPYKGIEGKKILNKVEDGYRIPKPPMATTDIYNMLLRCWDLTPENRPSFEYLFHFFDGLTRTSAPI